MKVTLERLKEVLSYDPATGILRWRVSPSWAVKAGDRDWWHKRRRLSYGRD